MDKFQFIIHIKELRDDKKRKENHVKWMPGRFSGLGGVIEDSEFWGAPDVHVKGDEDDSEIQRF